MPGKNRAHYKGSYARRAKLVRDRANADPSTRCWRCGELGRPGDPWQAGHVRDGEADSPLRPEHMSCNIKAGRRLREPRSRRW